MSSYWILAMKKKLPHPFGYLFQPREGLSKGDNCPKYIDQVKAFVKDYPDITKKDYFISSKVKAMRLAGNFETWGVDPTVDDSTYLATFFVCWLYGYVLVIPPPTFIQVLF